jgi:hypothetical protein
MAIGKAEKAAYNDEIKDLKKEVEEYTRKIKEIQLTKMKKMTKLAEYFNLEIATYYMNIINLYLRMNNLSLDMLKQRNEKFLNEARKEFYKVLQALEGVVGDDVDRTLRSNDEYLAKIDRLNPTEILDLIRRVTDVFVNIRSQLGDSSKWKWSFVELQSRVAVITKNITNFSDIAKLRDPRTEYYNERKEMMQMCKDGLAEAAKQFRTKYELTGKARDDMKQTIWLLSALRKIHVLFGESDEANKLKTTIDANKQALQAEDEAKDKKKKSKK